MSLKTTSKQFFSNTRLGLFFYILAKRFFSVGCTYRSASLVYTSLLGLVPFLFISLTLLSLLPGHSDLHDPLSTWFGTMLTPTQITDLNTFMEGLLARIQQLSIFNAIFLAVACVLMVYNMAAALSDIWDMHQKRAWWVSLIVYIVTVVIGPLSMGAISIVWAVIRHWPYLDVFQSVHWLTVLSGTVVPYIILGALLTVLNVVLPSGRVPWFAALMGSACTIFFFILTKWLFVSVIMNRPMYHILYGNLAVFPLLMLWLYLIWVVVLLGALIGYNIANGLSLASLKRLANEL